MALTSQFQNHISRTVDFANQIILLNDALARHRAEWDQNLLSTLLNDADILEVFPHLTKTEVSNAITALDAVRTALGDYSTGQIVNLVKVRG